MSSSDSTTLGEASRSSLVQAELKLGQDFRGNYLPDARTWIHKYSTLARAEGWSDRQKIRFLPFFMGDQDSTWLEQSRWVRRWSDMEALFLQAFVHPDEKELLENRLYRRQLQPDETVRDYFNNVLHLCWSLDPAMDEDLKIRRVLAGLPDSWRFMLVCVDVKSLEQLCSVLLRLERFKPGGSPVTEEPKKSADKDKKAIDCSLVKEELGHHPNSDLVEDPNVSWKQQLNILLPAFRQVVRDELMLHWNSMAALLTQRPSVDMGCIVDTARAVLREELGSHVPELPPPSYLDSRSEAKWILDHVEAIQCNQCGQYGHIQTNCPFLELVEAIQCNECGQYGHIKTYCPFVDHVEAIQCNQCGQYGHIQTNCPFLELVEAIQCNECGQYGHIKTYCPFVDHAEAIQCNQCGQYGHIQTNCPFLDDLFEPWPQQANWSEVFLEDPAVVMVYRRESGNFLESPSTSSGSGLLAGSGNNCQIDTEKEIVVMEAAAAAPSPSSAGQSRGQWRKFAPQHKIFADALKAVSLNYQGHAVNPQRQ